MTLAAERAPIEGDFAAVEPKRRLTFLVVALAALTSSWTGVRIGGVNLSDPLIAVGAAMAFVTVKGRPRLPWFVLLPVGAVAAFVLRDVLVGRPLTFEFTGFGNVVGEARGNVVTGPAILALRFGLSFLAVAVAIVPFRGSRRAIGALAGTWATGAAISAIWAFAQTELGYSDLAWQFHITSPDRAFGLANHPNSLGQSAAMSIGILLWMAIGSHAAGARVRLIGIGGAAACGYAVSASGSRTALVIIALTVLVAGSVLMSRGRRSVLLIPILLLTAAAALLWTGPLLASSRFSDRSADASDILRNARLDQGWDIFANAPLMGSGIYRWQGEMVPLLLLTSGGLLMVAAFYAAWLLPTFRLLRFRGDQLMKVLGVAGLAFLVAGFLNNALVERYLYWPLLLGGLALVTHSRALDRR